MILNKNVKISSDVFTGGGVCNINNTIPNKYLGYDSDRIVLNNDEVKKNIDIILKKITKDTEKDFGFLEDIKYWLEEQEIENARNKEDIIKIFRRIFTNFAVPGIISKEGGIVRKATLDFQSILFLINKYFLQGEKYRLFFQKNKDRKYLGYTNFGLGKGEGLGIEGYEENGLKSFFSSSTVTFNQGETKGYSLSHMVYKIIDEFGLIDDKEKEQIIRFINFIDLATIKKYEVYGKSKGLYEKSNKTIFGLSGLIHSEKLFNYFKDEKTGFELLNDDEIKNLGLYNASIKRTFNVEKSLSTYEEYSNKNNTVRYNNQKLDFIVDMGGKIVNSLELAASKNKGLIKVHPTGDIMIFNPKGFAGKMDFLGAGNDKVVFIKTTDTKYYEKMEELVQLLTGYKAKYNLLKFIGYEGDLLKQYKPKISAEIRKRRKEIDRIVKAKVKKRNKRKENHINTYLNQNLKFEELKKGQIVNGKVLSRRKNGRITVNIKLDNYDIDVYTTSRRLKCSGYTNEQILKPVEEKEEIIYTFVITFIDENRVVLKQI